MACFHPLKGFRIGITETGSNKYKICSWDVDHVDFNGRDAVPVCEKDSITPRGWTRINRFIEIPCGQCAGCREQRSREWANRLMCEAKYYDENWFITITYDDKNVPVHEFVADDGTILNSLSLQPEDLQKFWKRLRKEIYPQKIRYFAAGEYGDHTARPHYHAIVFGLHIPDLCVYTQDSKYVYYKSDLLNRIWSKGNIIIASVSWASCAYVAAYCTKKLTGDAAKEVYGKLNIEPPFNVMSRRPGIGRQFYDDNIQDMDPDSKFIYLATPERGVKFSRPRYYKKLDMAIHDSSGDISFDIKSEIEELHRKFDDIEFDNRRNRDIVNSETNYILSLNAKEAEKLAERQRKERKL